VSRVGNALKHAWNIFTNQEIRIDPFSQDYGAGYSRRPDRLRYPGFSNRTIVSSIYTRLSIDVASVDMRHVRVDEQNRYLNDIDSGLNNCLTVEANLDQAARALRQDIAMTLFERGCAALVPVDTSINPEQNTGGVDILTLRVGDIVQWYPQHIRVSLYNEKWARREEITLPKS